MLSVIVEARGDGEKLPGLLALLTSAAVEGLVREVVIAGGGPEPLLAVLREETGAELASGLAPAIVAARSELLLVVGEAFRPRPGWVEQLGLHLRGGGREALLIGEGGGLLNPAPYAVLVGKSAAAGLAQPDLKRLRACLGRGASRIGQV